MVRLSPSRGRVVAVLGPTNTGKTHFAVERMLAHRTGLIGFPLRLLAREIYDRIVGMVGTEPVALITGEEKLGSEQARYVVATTEAMPVHREFGFLAVDEIQLAADQERGHVFTERLLHARGLDETVFLGSDTIRHLLKQLVPEAEIVSRPRFSTLSHAGSIRLTRLPRRSAVVAFTAAEVYSLGEVMRRQKGGAAIVLGALSPRTRNAQVAMYQSGEVDHLVATDAIGMGLNMDVGHVAFAQDQKFDGRIQRRLTAPEMAQIAGRAGRHMADGTFGTTNGLGLLDEKLVEAIETHSFPPLKTLRWRNARLDFASLRALGDSLDARPPAPCLVKVRDALDDRSLGLLSRRPEIRERADRPDRVRLLWQVCQIPDFRKTLTDAHVQLLATIFLHLSGPAGRLPKDWVANILARLERTDGDIDALVGRIAHVRTWTYVSHRDNWLEDALHWQERARAVEDRLSDALHERLTQRFVDRRTSALMRSLREQDIFSSAVQPDGEVTVDGHAVGTLDGLAFTPARTTDDTERRVLAAAARRVVAPELLRRAKALVHAADAELTLDDLDRIVWQGAPVARLAKGQVIRRPQIRLLAAEELGQAAAAVVERRLERWLEGWLAPRLAPLDRLAEAAAAPGLGGPARGIAYRLVEALGTLERDDCASLLADLSESDHQRLGRMGVRFGRHVLYLPPLLKPAAVEARRRLWRLFTGEPLALPPPGRIVARPEADRSGSAKGWLAMGFSLIGERLALRVDMLERLAAGLRALARSGPSFALPLDLAATAGLGRAELIQVMAMLGYAEQPGEVEGAVAYGRAPVPPRRAAAAPGRARPKRAQAVAAGSPFAALAVLKAGA